MRKKEKEGGCVFVFGGRADVVDDDEEEEEGSLMMFDF